MSKLDFVCEITKLSLDKIFYKVVYHHIICMCDFFDEFRRPFCRGLHKFLMGMLFRILPLLELYTLSTHASSF